MSIFKKMLGFGEYDYARKLENTNSPFKKYLIKQYKKYLFRLV
jgi:hypothetical protein